MQSNSSLEGPMHLPFAPELVRPMAFVGTQHMDIGQDHCFGHIFANNRQSVGPVTLIGRNDLPCVLKGIYTKNTIKFKYYILQVVKTCYDNWRRVQNWTSS